MPLLEYRCKGCSSEFEWLTGVVADDSGPVCPRCGGQEHTRRLSVFAAPRGGEGASASDSCGESACGGGSCGYPGSGCQN